MTIQGWDYSEVMALPEDVRIRFVEKCEEHQEKMEEELDKGRQ